MGLPAVEIRPLRADDFPVVAEVMEDSFGAVIESLYGRRPQSPLFSTLMYSYRLAADPEGCHVAVAEGEVVGANFSIARGRLGWFGPIAVRREVQGRGTAQALVGACIDSWQQRDVRLMGLETFPTSPLHLNLYMKLGFRPSWTGVSYRGQVPPEGPILPAAVEVDGPVPNLDYLYPGLDLRRDGETTRSSGAGVTLTAGSGFALCHVNGTLWGDPALAYLPLLVAPDRDTFELLLTAVEAIARAHGRTGVATQVAGGSWATHEALGERGYRAGSVSLRMKRGTLLDYELGGAYCCDDWH